MAETTVPVHGAGVFRKARDMNDEREGAEIHLEGAAVFLPGIDIELPKPIVDRTWDAQARLCRRYRKLVARGKQKNIAVIAVARELSGFIWDISRLAMSLAVRQEALTT